ncbi:MAG: NfeD family protein [Armatimonadota bacterium]|nr:NfeD family protein [bacterium]
MVVWSPIALVYLGCLVFGFLLALITAIFGEILGHADIGVAGHDIDLGGHDIDLGHGLDAANASVHSAEISGHADSGDMTGANVFNTLTIMTFIASFGLSGLFALWVLKLQPALSLAFATPMGILLAAAQFLLYVNLFVKAQASSEATMSETLGCEAEVITAIPEGHIGEIAYVVKGSRYNAPASSVDGEEIARGVRVYVVNIKANTFIVRPM